MATVHGLGVVRATLIVPDTKTKVTEPTPILTEETIAATRNITTTAVITLEAIIVAITTTVTELQINLTEEVIHELLQEVVIRLALEVAVPDPTTTLVLLAAEVADHLTEAIVIVTEDVKIKSYEKIYLHIYMFARPYRFASTSTKL